MSTTASPSASASALLARRLATLTSLPLPAATTLLASSSPFGDLNTAILFGARTNRLTAHQAATARLTLHFDLSPATAERFVRIAGTEDDVVEKVRKILKAWKMVKESRLRPEAGEFVPRGARPPLRTGLRPEAQCFWPLDPRAKCFWPMDPEAGCFVPFRMGG